jgi:hypothetical protein
MKDTCEFVAAVVVAERAAVEIIAADEYLEQTIFGERSKLGRLVKVICA